MVNAMKSKKYWIRFEKCKLCASTKKKLLFSKPFTNKNIWSFLENFYDRKLEKEYFSKVNFEVAKCQKCGFIWHLNVLNSSGMQQLYENWIDPKKSFDRKFRGNINHYRFTASDVLAISSFFKKSPHEVKVLDFGMGWGVWSLMVKACGYDSYGLEISKNQLDHGKNLGIKVYSSIAELDMIHFDFIHAEQVFEHIPSPLESLKSLVDLLPPGGIVYISVPNGKNIESEIQKSGWRLSKNAIVPPEHINCFTRATLKFLAKQAGLTEASQPFTSKPNANLYELAKNTGGHLYQRFFSTSMYFKKT